MKKLIIMFLATLSLMVFSCKKSETITEKPAPNNTTQAAAPETIVDSVVNKNGVMLKMRFDNANETAVFELNGEKIETKQERSGSGIKYSNAQYQFSEHQGTIEVTKDGKTIYTYEEQ